MQYNFGVNMLQKMLTENFQKTRVLIRLVDGDFWNVKFKPIMLIPS